jgi:prophage regulatory protein
MEKPLDRFLRLHDVLRVTGVGRSTLYQQIASGDFPKPVRISLRAVAWRESDLVKWQQDRISESNSAPVVSARV